jgi:anoctamin-10/anoctamin-7
VWIFILVEHAIFGCKVLFELLVEDVPADVELQLARQEFLVDKVIKLQGDDDDEEMLKGTRIKTNLRILDSWQNKAEE